MKQNIYTLSIAMMVLYVFSVPIITEAAVTAFSEKDGVVSMEAEHFSKQVGYEGVTPDGASDGQAMQVGGSGNISYKFSVKTGGTWYFWVRTQAHGHSMNGLFLDIDGKRQCAPKGHTLEGINHIYLKKSETEWFWTPEWQGAGKSKHEGPIAIELKPGKHTLTIGKRKKERPYIDKIVLTVKNSAPTGTGPTETTGASKKKNSNTVNKAVIETDSLPGQTVGDTVEFQVVASGGETPYKFSAVGLPKGLKISRDGKISGTPSKAKLYTVKIKLLDGKNRVTRKSLAMTVNQADAEK